MCHIVDLSICSQFAQLGPLRDCLARAHVHYLKKCLQFAVASWLLYSYVYPHYSSGLESWSLFMT